MACIKVSGPLGERLIPEGPDGVVTDKRIDEEIIGVSWDCGPTLQNDPEVDRRLEGAGIPWGSAIAWATAKVGIAKCTSCKAREYILNHAKELGWAETFKQIRDTFK